jgi:hypothetical protein
MTDGARRSRPSRPRKGQGSPIGIVGVLVAAMCLSTTGAAQRQAPASPPAPIPTTGTCAISGVVTDAATGAPLGAASVLLISVRDAAGAFRDFRHPAALTDAKGRFVFTDLPCAFSYVVASSHIGYNVGETADGAAVKLAEGEWKRDVKIVQPKASFLSGRVTDERGESVVGTTVRLFARRLVAGHEMLLGAAVSSTDDRGVYRMAFLEPGFYFVAVLSVQATVPATVLDGERVLPLGGLEGRRSGPVMATVATARGANIDGDARHRLVLTNYATPPPPGGNGARAYPPMFYPNARTVADAQAVEVPKGGGITNIDIQLTPVPASTLSGQISGAVDHAANTVLRLMPQGGEHLGFGSEVATTVVESDGRFTFLSVPRGDYTLIASPLVGEISTGQSGIGRIPQSAGTGVLQGYSTQYPSVANTNFMWWQPPGDSAAWGRVAVSVEGDVSTLDLPLHATSSAGGHVVVDDPSELQPDEQFDVALEPANADLSIGVLNSSTRGDDHDFSMSGLRPARYVLRVGPAFRGWRVTSVVAHGTNLTDAGFDAAAGQNFDDIVVSVTKTGAVLTGTVHDRNGAPAAAAVILFPVDARTWVDYGFTPDRLRSVSTDSNGNYRIPPLREGEYFIVAVPVSQARAWIDPRFLTAASAQATRLTLTSAAKTQNLSIAEVIVK